MCGIKDVIKTRVIDKTKMSFKNAKAFINYVMRFKRKSIVWLHHNDQYWIRKDGELKMATPFEYILLCKRPRGRPLKFKVPFKI